MKQLEWKTKQVKVSDLILLDINPRKISDDKKKKLIESLEKFNIAEIPAVNTDMTVIGGNQRVTALIEMGRGDEMIDVRIPSRKLTAKELKEYSIVSNTHAGEFDFEKLELHFSDIDYESIIGVKDLESKFNDDILNEEQPSFTNQFFINIRCESEEHAQELYEEFLKKGLDVKIIT